MREPDVTVRIDLRAAEVRGRELVTAGERRPHALVPSDDRVLLGQPHPVPGLDEHGDLPRDEVRTAGHPGRLVVGRDPDVVRERRGVVGEDVGRAVLEAEEVARRRLAGRGTRGLTESELRPAQARPPERDAAEVADRVNRDLGVVGTGLDAQVAVRRRGIEVVPEEGRKPLETGWPLGGETVAIAVLVLEQSRTEPEREGQARGGEPQRLPRVIRGRFGGTVHRAARTHLQALRHPRRGVRPVLQQGDEVVPVGAGHHVEAREVQVVLHGRRDARLVRAEELVPRLGVFRGSCASERHAAGRPGPEADGQARDPAADGQPEQPAAAETAAGGRSRHPR